MAGLQQFEIRCQHCRTWFASPVIFGEDESIDTSTLMESTVTCSHCGRQTGCDQANVRVRGEREQSDT